MDINREDRRSNSGASNGLSRRRQRATPLRYVLEEEGPSDGVKKRDRGRDLLSRSKRRKEGRLVVRREDGEDTTEESIGDEDGNEIGVSESSPVVVANHNQNSRKCLPLPPSMMEARHVPGLNAADEVIGVAVPRKARSNVSVRKRKKPSSEPDAQVLQLSKCSSSVSQGQEDIEIEIAEVLYGLMKHSNGSSREENDGNNLQRPGSNYTNASREQKLQADPSPVQGNSVASAVKHESCEVSNEIGASRGVSGPPELQEEAIKQWNSTPAIEEYRRTTEEKSSSGEEKLDTCSKMDADLRDSIETREISTVSEVESRQEEKFKIDLMAPPPMASSPQEDGCVDLSSDPKSTSSDVELKTEYMVVKDDEEGERSMNKEAVVVELKEMIKNSGESELKFDSDKPNHDSTNEKCSQMRETQQFRATNSKGETTAEASSYPAPFVVAGCPTSHPPLGYIPPFQTAAPMNGTNSSSTPKQSGHIPVSHRRPKRCTTHHHIACNIRVHQQRMKMNHFWPAEADSTTLGQTNPSNINPMHSSENTIIQNPLQGSFPIVNMIYPHDKAHAMASLPLYTKKDGSEGPNLSDSAKKKQLVPHHSPQPAPVGNIVNGPAFIFSLSQHQAPVGAIVNQPGGSTSAASMASASLSGSVLSGVAPQASPLPVITAVNFNYSNLPATEAPYLTILPHNGYQFPISSSVGNPPRLKRENLTQALPFYNGSFHSPQMLQSSQLKQQQQRQQPFSQPLVQSVHHNASSGLSSSPKQPQNQRGPHFGSGKFFTSVSTHSQQNQDTPSSQSLKLETQIGGTSSTIIADAGASLPKKAAHSHNFAVSFPPNFSVVPSITVGGSGNRDEKQHSRVKNLKGAVELIPSQANAMPFASFGGSNTPSNLNFSYVAQNPTNLQIFPDMTRQGYQVLSAPQATQKKNHRVSEGKTGGSLTNPDDCKKTMEKLTSAGQTLVFDKSVRSFNFVSSSFPGNWPSHSIMSTTSTPVTSKSLNSQQQQLQQQHTFHKKIQHPNGPSRSKTPAVNPLHSLQNPQWKNSSRAPASQTLHPPFVASNASTQKDASKLQGRALQSHNQISFGGDSESTSAQLGQHPRDNHSPSPVAAISRHNDGSLKSASVSTNANSSVPGLHSQQSDNSSSTGNAQKFSPVCGRNVPSILGTCPSHVSEMKY